MPRSEYSLRISATDGPTLPASSGNCADLFEPSSVMVTDPLAVPLMRLFPRLGGGMNAAVDGASPGRGPNDALRKIRAKKRRMQLHASVPDKSRPVHGTLPGLDHSPR